MLARVLGRVNSHMIAVLMKSYKSHLHRPCGARVMWPLRLVETCDGFVLEPWSR
jgi:hypothetical protein